MNISEVSALEILDSRGEPTVEAYVKLDDGTTGHGAVPSGASTGSHEALELHDNTSRYHGEGVQKAVALIRDVINPALLGKEIDNLEFLDNILRALDNSPQKKKLGANTILAVSLALSRTLSIYKKEPLWKTLHDG